jgi:hypothetical protein
MQPYSCTLVFALSFTLNAKSIAVCWTFVSTATGIRSRPILDRFDPIWLEMTGF